MTRTAGAPGTAGHGYRDVVHVTGEDCTDTRRVDPDTELSRAIDLLELNPDGHQLVRLTVAQWDHVDRVVAQIDELRVPRPRAAGDALDGTP